MPRSGRFKRRQALNRDVFGSACNPTTGAGAGVLVGVFDLRDEPRLMTTDVILARMRDYSVIGVSQTASLIMGGVFATAAVTFTEILRERTGIPVRLSGWLFGVTASIMVLDGLVRRALIEARPIFRAVPMVALGGLLSMLAFALLGPAAGGPDGWRYTHLLVVAVGVLVTGTFGPHVADHVEPALQPLYESFASRSRSRVRQLWIMVLLGLVPFGLAMADKFTLLHLQWEIVATNIILCVVYIFSLVRSHRYYEGIYNSAYNSHLAKWEIGASGSISRSHAGSPGQSPKQRRRSPGSSRSDPETL